MTAHADFLTSPEFPRHDLPKHDAPRDGAEQPLVASVPHAPPPAPVRTFPPPDLPRRAPSPIRPGPPTSPPEDDDVDPDDGGHAPRAPTRGHPTPSSA